MIKRLVEWCRRHDRDVWRKRLSDPDWIAFDQERRHKRFKEGITAGIAFLSVGGYREFKTTYTNLRWTTADLPMDGEWEVIVRRTDVGDGA